MKYDEIQQSKNKIEQFMRDGFKFEKAGIREIFSEILPEGVELAKFDQIPILSSSQQILEKAQMAVNKIVKV